MTFMAPRLTGEQLEMIISGFTLEHEIEIRDEIPLADGLSPLGIARSLLQYQFHFDYPQISKAQQDLETIEVQLNVMKMDLYPTTLENGFTYFGLQFGVEWHPLVFGALYYDGVGLRIYIPKNGNTFNHLTREMFDFDQGTVGENVDEVIQMCEQFPTCLVAMEFGGDRAAIETAINAGRFDGAGDEDCLMDLPRLQRELLEKSVVFDIPT